MSASMRGYTLIEVLIVVAMVAVLVGAVSVYTMNDANLQLAELEFREHYQKAKSILTHAQNLHVQGFRSANALNIEQLQTATRGSDREAIVNQIVKITADHARDDFKIQFDEKYIQVQFLVADEVMLAGYPLQKHSIVGSKDEVRLRKMLHTEPSRILKSNDYLMN